MTKDRDTDPPVVHLADYDPAKPGRITGEMRAYWQSLCKGRAIPERADIEPRGIRRGLDYAFILERIAPGAARFRLAGRHLIDLMGMEVRGMPLAAFANPQSRGRLSDVLETVFKGPQIAELDLLSEAGYGRPALSGRMLLLPLRSDLGDVTRALGCLIAEGAIGAAPRRFDITNDHVEAVIAGAQPLTPGFSDDDTLWRAPSDPEEPEPPTEHQSPEERRARFRLISSTPEQPDRGKKL